MTNNITISIIVPTYKPQSYLWECLESLKNQTFPKEKFEIILVLNGCNEPSFSNISKYIYEQLIGYNVNFIQIDKGGVSNARNLAIDASKGDFITFIDDDDYVSRTYISDMYEVAKKGYTPIAKIVGLDDKTKRISSTRTTKRFDKLRDKDSFGIKEGRRFLSSPVMKLIDKRHIGDRRYNVRFANGEDALFMFSISDKMNLFKCTSSDAIYYRRYREGSAVSNLSKTSVLLKNSILLSIAFCNVWAKNPLKYNFKFFLTRIAAPIKDVLFRITSVH